MRAGSTQYSMRSLAIKFGLIVLALCGAGALWVGVAQAPYSLIPQERDTVVLFLGDTMLDRGVARRAATTTPGGTLGAGLVAGMHPLVQEADLVVLNLEGTVTANESIAQRDNTILRFTFAPDLTQSILAALGVSAVSLANNHALDFYPAGYDETIQNLQAWGVAHFGHPLNNKNLSTTLVHNNRTICLVGYHELYDPSTAEVLEEIARVRPSCDALVVMPHWGPEYEPLPSKAQVAEGRAFIDAGADLVVGMHPHVVQPIEVYRGKAIAYSLGNFVFDQDFSWETRHGLALLARFGTEGTTLTLVPLAIEQSRPAPAVGDARSRVIQAAGGVETLHLP